MKRILYTLIGIMLSTGAWAQTLQEQINSAAEATTIQLSGNVDLGATTLIIPADKNITIDLNGYSITSSASGAVAVKNNGTLTVKDTSGEHAGKIISTKHAGIGAGDNSTTTFESGNIESVEGAIITGKVVGATITINGGTLSASDNAVIMGNGSARDGNANTITINGGTFNGQIKSAGYVACGIYAPWKDVITVNAGTFNITNGCGVLARAGSVTINGGEFNCSGTATGKVGDSRVVVPCSAVVYDSQAGYPAMTAESKIEVPSTSTAKFTAASGVAAVSVVGESHIEISGGTYSSPLTEDVCAEGYIPSNTPNADGTYGAVEGSYVAQIGEVKYASLAEAVTAATTGEIVKLIADENTTSQIEIAGKEITLDLNGHAVTYKGTTALKSGVLLVHNGAGLTVNATGGGAINSGENAYAAIALTKNGDDASSPAKLTVNGGNITGYYYAITGHGSRPNTEITINDGTITATASDDSQGIYHPQDGKLTITGGTITAYSTAVEMRAGTLDISGGEFTATATEYSCNPNGSGTTTIGAAIAIAQHTTKKDINVTISGGTFTGVKAVNESNPQANDPAPHVVMFITDGTFHGDVSTVDVQNFISGGTFSSAVPEEYCADGFIPQDNGDGTYGVTEGTYVAQVGETKYTTITEAIEAATDGQTITLLADVTVDKTILVNQVSLTIDGNGKTIKSSVNSKLGTFYVNNKTCNLTIQNTTIDGQNSASMAVCVYRGKANGTLDGTSATDNDNAGNSVTLTNCTVQNFTGYPGSYVGAVYAFSHSHLTLNNCTFTGNTTSQPTSGASGADVWTGAATTVVINGGTYNEVFVNTNSSNVETVTINGGAIIEELAICVSYKEDGSTNIPVLTIDNATVTNLTTEEGNPIPAEGITIQNGGTITNKPATEAAKILNGKNTKAFASLDDAIEAATAEQTITLLADATIETIDVVAGKTINKNGHEITVNTFEVIDFQACNIPFDFTANTAKYTRNVAGNEWGTVCVPFTLKSTEAIKLYEFGNITGDVLTVNEVETAAPGTPVVFANTAKSTSVTFTTEDASVNATATSTTGTLIGTYTEQKINSGLESIYFINGDKFHQAKASLTVPAYRAYIKNTSAGAKAAVLNIVVDATAIESVATDLNTATAIYDVNGRQLSAPQKGINIMKLANGKSVKLIIK